jgi:hypothetical protein
MSAVWQKNEPTAVKRRCDLRIFLSDGVTRAPRGTDFMALGGVYISGVASPHYRAALGTMTNKRRELVVADDVVESVDATANTLTLTAHGLETGDGPVQFTNSGGALPAGISAATNYWIINPNTGGTGGNLIKLATSLANAYAGTAVDITGAGTGTHTLVDTVDTARGLDGFFTYEATQPETNHDAPETSVLLEYPAGGFAQSYTTVNMASAGENVWDAVMEGGHTYGDGMRAQFRGEVAPYTEEPDGTQIIMSVDGTKESHRGTVTSSGRSGMVINDLTP